MKKYLLIYHKEDNDGVVSAALFYNYLEDKLKIHKNDIELLGADYNDLNDFKSKNTIESLKEQFEYIVMTDISISDVDYMNDLYGEFGSKFLWFDHHKPIIDESYKNNFGQAEGVRNTNKSAILCVYEWLYDQFNDSYSKKDIPFIFRVLSAWDSWTWEKEDIDFNYARDVNKGFTYTYNLDFDHTLNTISLIMCNWERYHSDVFAINSVHDLGLQLNGYEDEMNANIIKNYGDTSWKVDLGNFITHDCCAIFVQSPTNSLVFKTLQGASGIRHGLVFKRSPNSKWVLSMYNINDEDDFHCGDFLRKRYNGGGHKGAAGCTLTEDQFIDILKKRTI